MGGELAGKSAAQGVCPQSLPEEMDKLMHPELPSNMPTIPTAKIHTEEPVAGTNKEKFTSDHSPDPQNSLNSNPTNAYEIKKNSIVQACHPNKTTDQASKAECEEQERFFDVCMTGIVPAFVSFLFMLGNPEPSDRLVTFLWCFFTFFYVYFFSLLPSLGRIGPSRKM
jgi:hypothetical protein